MRKFSSYGPVSKESHFYVPRTELVNQVREYLLGKNQDEGGHYITVWASRQSGKSWLMRELNWELQRNEKNYISVKIELEILKKNEKIEEVIQYIIRRINELADISIPKPQNMVDFEECFSKRNLPKPLILILDEFDALPESIISSLVSSFRNIYLNRQGDMQKSPEKDYLLHGVALIGVRSVVGVENQTGSPFNVQRSLHISNLTREEVFEMYEWYERESNQKVDREVIEKVFSVTQGQPGLVSWFGELLTERYPLPTEEPITIKHFDLIYKTALSVLPNNNIINLISKANEPEHKPFVLSMFKTREKTPFEFEDPSCKYLYMNGVITFEESEDGFFAKFPSQFVQEKLFKRFTREIYNIKGNLLVDPFIDVEEIVNDEEVVIRKLIGLYKEYFVANKDWILERAAKRADNRVFEANYHFSIFSWLESFLRNKGVFVQPEFPTGNGKIDLILHHPKRIYGLELKSFSDFLELKKSIKQAAKYGKTLNLETIHLIVFVEATPTEKILNQYESPIFDESEKIFVDVIFVEV